MKTSLLNGVHFLQKIKESSTSVPFWDLQRRIKYHTLVSLPIMTLDESMVDVQSLNSKGPLDIIISEVSCPATPDEPSNTVDTQNIPSWEPQPSLWKPLCHPRVEQVSLEVDRYFLHHWEFPSEKAGRAFINAGFSRVTCLYFPLAQDDRIHFACRLLTVLFLIDGKKYLASSIFSTNIQRNWG